jgi:acyl-CoA thioesterase-1
MGRVRSGCGDDKTGSVTNGALSRRRDTLLALLAGFCALGAALVAPSAADPIRIVAFGDSLTAGLGLEAKDAFPVKLEAALKAKGYDVRIVNAGVSGDTATAGLARLDWSIPQGTHAVILELGANDALRGISPAVPRLALDAMVRRLKERHIEVLLAGMRAPRNLGSEYAAAFDRIYPDIAKTHDLVLYPFFLDGIAGDPRFNQPDGLHPNPAGIDIIVENILPPVEKLISRVETKRKN